MLHIISQKSDYRFLYNNDLLPQDLAINIAVKQETVPEIIKTILKNSGLTFRVLNNKLIAIGYEHQDINQVTGKVTDKSGHPLVGVTIQIKGTTVGTVTDAEGNFSLDIPANSTLIVSSVGFETQNISYGGQSQLNIILAPSATGLNEVIVVGYGTEKKGDLTGSVASVNMPKATAIPTTNIAEMLRGRVAGLQVTQFDNRPGGSSNITLRGTRSIMGGNSPLFVVDGAPVDNINDINADDIASIEVLKDASAQAIYGARAANGVILVTTKRGTPGKIKVNYNGYVTIQKLTRNFSLYSPEEFIQLRREANRAENFI
ncbi:MAG: carboxypeptidase-like regulatory domain-containing protein, partial [Chitinophagaceae bacterium]